MTLVIIKATLLYLAVAVLTSWVLAARSTVDLPAELMALSPVYSQ